MDKLQMLSGSPYEINDNIIVHHPRLRDIREYGEDNYWQLISMLTSTSYDMRFQLDDMGFDYEDVDDFTVFCMVLPIFKLEDTRILFGDMDMTLFYPETLDDGSFLLTNHDGVVIDPIIYELLVKFIRDLHGMKRNYKIAGNKMARKFYMEEERKILEQKAEEAKGKDYESTLEPLISSMVNCSDFKYNYETVWDLPIYTFFDASRRVAKLSNYRNLMTGIYTGNVEAKKIPDSQLNWMGEL